MCCTLLRRIMYFNIENMRIRRYYMNKRKTIFFQDCIRLERVMKISMKSSEKKAKPSGRKRQSSKFDFKLFHTLA